MESSYSSSSNSVDCKLFLHFQTPVQVQGQHLIPAAAFFELGMAAFSLLMDTGVPISHRPWALSDLSLMAPLILPDIRSSSASAAFEVEINKEAHKVQIRSGDGVTHMQTKAQAVIPTSPSGT